MVYGKIGTCFLNLTLPIQFVLLISSPVLPTSRFLLVSPCHENCDHTCELSSTRGGKAGSLNVLHTSQIHKSACLQRGYPNSTETRGLLDMYDGL